MNPILILIPGLIVVAILANYLLKKRNAGLGAPTWARLAQVIAGSVDGEGVKGTYEGRAVRASVKHQDDLLMPNPFQSGFVRQELGGWVYKLMTSLAPSGGGQGWTVSYDGSKITSAGNINEAFIDRFQRGGLELEFAKVGAGQLIYEGASGALTLERYFPVNEANVGKVAGAAPIPTRAQFRNELALLDGTAKMIS